MNPDTLREVLWEQLDDDDQAFATAICNNDFYLINNYQTDEGRKHNLFLIALAFSDNTEIIDILIDKFEINVTNLRPFDDLIMSACIDPWIIRHFVEHHGVDAMDYLIEACQGNGNIDIIRYLVENLGLETYTPDYDCFKLACAHNPNPDVIRYLAKLSGLNSADYAGWYGNKCLRLACEENDSIDVIKCLIEEFNVYMRYDDDGYGINNNYIACVLERDNEEMIQYFIEDTDFPLYGLEKYCDRLLCILPTIKNDQRFHDVLDAINKCKNWSQDNHRDRLLALLPGINIYRRFNDILEVLSYENPDILENEIINELKTENPLMFDARMCERFCIDPWSDRYDDFKDYVAHLECKIDVMFDSPDSLCADPIPCEKEILFKHNNITYHGSRHIVYGSMLLFQDTDFLTFNESTEPFELTVDVPEYIVRMYIRSCYTHRINLDQIKENDFEGFLNLIDRFPTRVLSIECLEKTLILYIDQHNDKLYINQHMKAMFERYGLKYMYLYMNKKMNIVYL